MTDPFPPEVLEAFGCRGGRVSGLEGGVMNRNWRIDRSGGAIVVREHNRLRTPDSVLWEHALIQHAAGKGWPAPMPVRAAGGVTVLEHDGRTWSATPFLPGAPGSSESPGMQAIYGRLLARLHRDLADFPVEGQRPGSGKTWELDSVVGAAGAGSFNHLLAEFGQDYPELAARIRRERYRSLRELSRLRYPDLPDRPIHGDFLPKNLLFEEARLTGLLDFDQARWDALACDIAPLFMPFMALDLGLCRAFLEGYESVRPLSEAEWELLPALVRAALLWWVSFLLVRWKLGGGEPSGVERTMTMRFPAWDGAEAAFRGLRRRDE